ncbi:MAG: uracil phosphoribosyltransferase [Alphaproteobacteria bacterium]|nr:uracil phosphoribosyltransferase [Alphaproteobacteria bacterium]
MANTPTVVNHPLVQHKLSYLRARETPPAEFRRLLREIGQLMIYEVLRDLPLTTKTIETPLTPMQAPVIDGKKLVLVSILRAGNGLLDGMLELVPLARVGHVGLYRDPESLEAVEYYMKLPPDIAARQTIVVDPMLATANTATAAVTKLKDAGAAQIKFACVLAAPEGVAKFSNAHPDVPLYTAAIDDHLNDHGYIVPGLGDAGDRIYGT